MTGKYRTTKHFDKQYAKLPIKRQDAVDYAIELFLDNPINPKLRNHKLTAQWRGHRSISAGGDINLTNSPSSATYTTLWNDFKRVVR